ncbi:aminotransferase class V-fold PLP-dependent enzyme, partial [Enterobacter hormaechei]
LAALDARLEALGGETALISVQAANNETGVVQPLDAIVALARKHGALVHSDAVQVVGRLPIAFDGLGLDALSL